MIDAGRERRDPFEISCARDEAIVDRNAEGEQGGDAREVDRDVRLGRRLADVEAGKMPAQLALVGVRELFQDEKLGHVRPRMRLALLAAISARSGSGSATVSRKCPASSADSNG